MKKLFQIFTQTLVIHNDRTIDLLMSVNGGECLPKGALDQTQEEKK